MYRWLVTEMQKKNSVFSFRRRIKGFEKLEAITRFVAGGFD